MSFSKYERELVRIALVEASKHHMYSSICDDTGIPYQSLHNFVKKGVLGEERLTNLAEWLIGKRFLLPNKVESSSSLETTQNTELEEDSDVDEVLPTFIFLPNALRHVNLSQITTITASPPRRNDEDDFTAHLKMKDDKKVNLFTKWYCSVRMSDGDTVNLHDEEARLFLELIEQISRPLKVPVKEPTSEK